MEESDKILLPHHEQQTLCQTRLPYRQGRKLTAVKVYSITNESNHLLIFGVPSLNLRQETKALFIKFGKLLQFNITTQHAAEPFTETYHAQYEKTQPARIAKKMLDTKNFYGGILHVCYAPEFETVEETLQKLIQRQRDVVFRLKNLEKTKNEPAKPQMVIPNVVVNEPKKLNMGNINTISLGKEIKEVKKKRNKKFKPNHEEIHTMNNETSLQCVTNDKKPMSNVGNSENIEIVDCTNVDSEVITNINESLNYNKFGTEIIRKIPEKPLNKIQFHVNKKS
ncbi:RNA-binding protein 48 [Vanessa cardui]|uniref:RNA-binding protein 48 n=1 Tax=Vanessa cardui TaxID=171605 RepID=UPI001F139BA4|nr:RNA-binding protein 48 [Vanessa cardui]